MAATKMKVTYGDGRVETVIASPKAQVAAERHLRTSGGFGDTTKIEASYYLAWASLHSAGKEGQDFDAWLDQVAEVEDADVEGEADPTPQAQSPTTSSD